MIVYQAVKKQFLDDVFKKDIETIVFDSYEKVVGKNVSKSEKKSWASSLSFMGKVLNDEGIPDDCGVAIEYTIPQSAKRVDFLLTGKTIDQRPCVVIVELKQWDSAKKTSKDGIVSTQFAMGASEVSHPSYQAWSYAALLEGFNEAVYDGGIQLKPCAYLHNYPEADGAITDPFYARHIERAPVFLKGDLERKRLRKFIQSHVRFGDKADSLYLIEGGRIRPSKSLADGLAGMLKGKEEFVLIDDQKLVYETALQHARKVREKGKRVLIVEGGPGTGKSVVAINLLVGLTSAGLTAKYVTKNAAPRAVYESALTGTMKKTHISHMFTGSGAYTCTTDNEFDALVVDEAHRLNEKSGLYGNLGDNQVKELIRAARFSVFFLDESQKVTLKDIGDKETIRHWAKESGATVEVMSLSSQFRCNGSDGYMAWLDHNLQVRDTANPMLDVIEFDFRIVDSPSELRKLILEKNKQRNRARMVAGYCWGWPSKKAPSHFDIVMPEYQFRARWNLTKDAGLWIVSPDSVEEVGCIHTCQGLEVDYVGVIVGDDLVVRDGKVIPRPEKRFKTDKTIHGLKKLAKENPEKALRKADEIIKNTYRTLMTRGMKGCYVYCTDKETADYFRSRLKGHRVADQPLPSEAARKIVDVRPFRVLPRQDVKQYQNSVPLVPLKIAAGAFSGGQTLEANEEAEWVDGDGIPVGPNIFIAQVVGESMNRRIPNGSWCVFRANPGGSRNGKTVLAQHRDIADPETGGNYTIKVYSSEKSGDATDGWKHKKIVLSPYSTDESFRPIVLRPDSESDVAIVAELVSVLLP